MAEKKSLLVIRKRFLNDETITQHATELSVHKQIDLYSAKTGLKGTGLAVIAKDDESALEPIGQQVGDLGYQWCVIPAKRPTIMANEVQSFKVYKDRIVVFDKNESGLTIEKDSRILIVVAGTEGRLAKKLYNRSILVKDGKTSLENKEKYNEVIHGNPVIDIYVIPKSLQGENMDRFTPIRFLPGKFNAESLGQHNTGSAILNMDKVARLFKSYVSQVSLELDFGLFQLPDCFLASDANKQRRYRKTLESITKYGNYLLHLYQQDEQHKSHNLVADDIIAANAAFGLAPAKKVEIGGYDENFKHENTEKEGEVLPSPPQAVIRPRYSGYFSGTNLFIIIIVALHIFGASALTFLSDAFRQMLLYWGKDRGFFIFMLSAAAFIYAFKYLKLKRYMDNTPTSKARSIAVGMAEMYGTTRRCYNLFSPITRTPCVYYRLKKYSKVQDHKGDSHWVLVSDSESSNVPFYLEDETGQVLVDPKGAAISATYKQTVSDALMAGHSDTRYSEEIIPEFSKLYVLGFAEPVRPAVKSIATKVAEKLRLLKKDDEKMKKYDYNNDGRIDEEEWESARSEMEYEALKETLSEDQTQSSSGEQIKIRKPNEKDLPFVISKSSERSLTTKYKWLSATLFSGAVILLAAGMAQAFKIISW